MKEKEEEDSAFFRFRLRIQPPVLLKNKAGHYLTKTAAAAGEPYPPAKKTDEIGRFSSGIRTFTQKVPSSRTTLHFS